MFVNQDIYIRTIPVLTNFSLCKYCPERTPSSPLKFLVNLLGRAVKLLPTLFFLFELELFSSESVLFHENYPTKMGFIDQFDFVPSTFSAA